MESLQKLLHIFKSSALRWVFRWTRCIRSRLAVICLSGIICMLCSL